MSDKIVNDTISGNKQYVDQKEAAAVTLYARYLKKSWRPPKKHNHYYVKPI